jgi:hypothetical protein
MTLACIQLVRTTAVTWLLSALSLDHVTLLTKRFTLQFRQSNLYANPLTMKTSMLSLSFLCLVPASVDGLKTRALKGMKGGMSKKGGMKGMQKGFKVSTAASGMQEGPTPVVTDTTAYLDLEFDAEMTQMEYSVNVYEGTRITNAHLHCAAAGLNGALVTVLGSETPGVDIDGELVSGVIGAGNLTATDFEAEANCGIPITNIASLYEAILQRRIYLNIHSEAYPDGEVRGQIF